MTQNGCYCCVKTSDSNMDIDVALNELGMLSAVTESRKQYLHERRRTQKDGVSINAHAERKCGNTGFKVVQFDPAFVTGFSSTVSPSVTHQTLPHTSTVTVDPSFGVKYRELETEADKNRKVRIRRSLFRKSRYKRFQRPYEVPWRLNSSLPEADMRDIQKAEIVQSKSNSSSPVKSFSDSCATTLTRSRSLGNLDFAKLSINEFIEKHILSTGEKEEMDKMSHHLENLHVTDKSL